MRRNILAGLILLGLHGIAHASDVQVCSNPFFIRSALDSLNQKNLEMKNLVVFRYVENIKDISRNYEDYIACRVTIIDNQGLTYNGVLEWSVSGSGFKFTPDVKQPTD